MITLYAASPLIPVAYGSQNERTGRPEQRTAPGYRLVGPPSDIAIYLVQLTNRFHGGQVWMLVEGVSGLSCGGVFDSTDRALETVARHVERRGWDVWRRDASSPCRVVDLPLADVIHPVDPPEVTPN